jgi:aminopeptidase N
MLQQRDGAGPGTVTHRADYSAPPYWVNSVHLSFDLDPAKTRVLNKMTLRRNPAVASQPLRLDGEELNLARVLVNGQGTAFKIDNQQCWCWTACPPTAPSSWKSSPPARRPRTPR